MRNTEHSKTCLLILQRSFHSFEKSLTAALQAKGYTVTVANDEYPTGFFGKVMGKLQFPLIFLYTIHIVRKNFLKDRSYDLAIIIKGRGVSSRLVNEMKGHVTKIIGYNWDSFKNNRAPLRWFKSVTKFCTFDYDDAKRFSIPYVELFSSLPMIENKGINYDLSAVGRNYSNRLEYIDKVLKILNPSKSFIHVYEQNPFDVLKNFLKSPRLYVKYFRYIHFKPLEYNEYMSVMSLSEFTIDYAHHKQTGITMRCYEALSMKTKVISNNPVMLESPYFNLSNHIYFPLTGAGEKLKDSYHACKQQESYFQGRDISLFLEELIS